MNKKILFVLWLLLIVFWAVPAFGASVGNTIDMADISPNDDNGNGFWEYDNDVYTVLDGAELIITGSNAVSERRINIAPGAEVKITLQSAVISSNTYAAINLSEYSALTLMLSGISTLTSGGVNAGINMESNSALIMRGPGALTVYGGDGCAGIGGGAVIGGVNDINITIGGGIINAYGGGNGLYGGAAGIGGNDTCESGTITINGGIITAVGGDGTFGGGAGIGGGNFGEFNTITITGGTINARGGNAGGAGIGGGYTRGGESIIITGGSINAVSSGTAQPVGHGAGAASASVPYLTDGNNNEVYLNVIIIPNITQPAAVDNENDVLTDNTGRLFFYLPASADGIISVSVNGVLYSTPQSVLPGAPQDMRIDISQAAVSVSGAVYNGAALTPGVTVTYGGNILAEGTHYNVSYVNNINAGNGEVIITGIAAGGFAGTKTGMFIIERAPVTVTQGDFSVSKVYDGTVTAGTVSGDFILNGAVTIHGGVTVSGIVGVYNGADAGDNRNVIIDLTLGGADAANHVLTNDTLIINDAVISPAIFFGTTPDVSRPVENGSVRTVTIPLTELTPVPDFGTLGTVVFDLYNYAAGDISTGAVIAGGNLTVTSADNPINANLSEIITIKVITQNFGEIFITVTLETVESTDITQPPENPPVTPPVFSPGYPETTAPVRQTAPTLENTLLPRIRIMAETGFSLRSISFGTDKLGGAARKMAEMLYNFMMVVY